MSIGNKTIIKQLMAISIQNNAQGDFHYSLLQSLTKSMSHVPVICTMELSFGMPSKH